MATRILAITGIRTNQSLAASSTIGGSHYLDWILQLIPDRVVSVRGVEHKRVWRDVTNADQASVRLRSAQGQEAEFLHSDIAAALKPKWYILGERGVIVGQWRHEVVKTRRRSGNLANHLHSGEGLAVPPEEARRTIAVMEAAKRSALAGGKIIELDVLETFFRSMNSYRQM